MAIGDVTSFGVASQTDEASGREVERLTDDYGDTFHPYFTQNLFSADGRELLVVSDRTGTWQLFNLIVEEGKLVQLTEDTNVSRHGPARHPGKPLAYYFAGGLLKEVSLEDFSVRTVYQLPHGFAPSIISLSADGRFAAFAYSEQLALSTGTGRIYSTMRERLFRHPASVVMYLDLPAGAAEAAWGEHEWISHVNISPADPDIVLFCHEGPWHLVQRLWVVRASSSQVWPLLDNERHVARAGHEFFLADGRVAVQYSRRDEGSDRWAEYVTVIWPDGSGRSDYRWPGRQPSHIQADRKGELWVGDRAHVSGPGEPHAHICLFRCADGEVEARNLCRHGSSWQSQDSHPHPIFSPDGGHVIFSSDAGGRCNVYRIRAEW